ncbi:ABC transporter permease [Halomicrobium salinisoli]|uniref:ABC transporter permease n=1 Tax=Halomicrobium salinisoli TaxID=2878391 RepID=UPI001CF01920|nr:ABC transporter permease [Halomicrobium salinisoli]
MSDEPNTVTDGGTAESSGTSADRAAGSLRELLLQRREVGVLFGFLVLFGLIAVTRPDIFFNWDDMSGITSRLLRQIAPYVIIGIGMTYLIIGGEFDLSVGSMYAVGGITFAMFLTDYRLTVPVALLAVLLIGVVVGLTNGVIVTKAGVPSLITTIGMLSILRGLAYYLTPAGSRQTPDLGLIDVFGGSVTVFGLEIAHQVFWAVGLTVVFGLLLRKTRFGYHVYATGDDQEAAEMTGIDTDRVKILNFVLTATLAAFAGVVAISYFGSMFGSAGSGFELLIIAAVVIGGTNLFGGEGSLLGMFVGSLVIGVIPVLLVLNGLSVEIQEFLTGVVIILAVLLDIFIRR